MSCHYGCWYGRKCMGTPREEVIEFLGFEAPNDVLNARLKDLADVDYTGPDHVMKEEVV